MPVIVQRGQNRCCFAFLQSDIEMGICALELGKIGIDYTTVGIGVVCLFNYN